ncbi:hypothetical protein F442_09159 [Phytophthora nicotianae P10297]|uniref:Uncharacterized protein n=1 Tax=Phytophthora nicotianae P10297 TaxID=1317064 RepID=W2ZDJ7_PHYNI|nr:hypothetical protein F442_09159 [Phytophthora nicotianae P10297]
MVKTGPGTSGAQGTVLGLTPLVFYLTWLVLLGFHSACILYLVVMAVTYFAMTTTENASYAPIWSDTGFKHFKAFGAIYLAIAALHVLQVLRIFYLSIRNKRLVLHCERSNSYCNDECKSGFCYFDVVFAVRELVILGCLSYQAYQSSKLVPRVELNNLNAAVLVVACWLTPLIQILLRKSIAHSRATSLLSSFILCTFLAKVMQSLVYIQYSDVFSMDKVTFATKMIYDPTFLAVLTPENRMMFATTVGDFVSKFLPLLGSFVSLVMLEGVISRRGEKVTPDICADASAKIDPSVNVTVETLDTPEGTSEPARLETGTSTKALGESRTAENASNATANHSICTWVFTLVKFSCLVWGILVLAFHLKAQSQHKTMPTGCFKTTRPWFSSKVSCLAFVFNCVDQAAMSPTNEAFEALNLDPDLLGSLNFVNCPALMVPSVIQTFPQLHSVQIFNTALYSWGANAALTQEFHPRLKSIVLISVKMTAFPEGLLGVLPYSLVNLQFFATLLPSLPSDLGTKWGGADRPLIGRVGFEYGILSPATVPAETFQLPVKSLSLAGNFFLFQIPTLAVVTNTFLPQLTLDGAPLMALPPTIDSTFTIGDLSMEGTKVAVLPDWTKSQVLSPMHLYGSAFCLTSTDAQKAQANGICNTSRWGTTLPKSPIERMEDVYGKAAA